ncbi:Yip1 domain-containing protein, partial [Globomyces pollinis-pini]
MRDVNNIWSKVKQVLDPRMNKSQNLLKDWDWWGPLLLCLVLSVRLSVAAMSDQGPAVFAATFFIIWFGSAIVTLNSQLLGGKISFFQSVCVLGYCIFPLVIVSLITWLLPFFLKLVLVIFAYIWATYASLNFLTDVNLENKRLLAIYPIFLFYFMIGWLVLVS